MSDHTASRVLLGVDLLDAQDGILHLKEKCLRFRGKNEEMVPLETTPNSSLNTSTPLFLKVKENSSIPANHECLLF